MSPPTLKRLSSVRIPPALSVPPMKTDTQRFDDVYHAVHYVHALFKCWEQNAIAPRRDATLLHRTKLALHEWLSNLVQHADFQNRAPDVSVRIAPSEERIQVVVEDNSAGFDLATTYVAEPDLFTSFPERGMGLHIIDACTDAFDYVHINATHHRLTLTVLADPTS